MLSILRFLASVTQSSPGLRPQADVAAVLWNVQHVLLSAWLLGVDVRGPLSC